MVLPADPVAVRKNQQAWVETEVAGRCHGDLGDVVSCEVGTVHITSGYVGSDDAARARRADGVTAAVVRRRAPAWAGGPAPHETSGNGNTRCSRSFR